MTLLSCANISHRYGSKAVLSDISFAVDGGTIVGLVGPNGSGKTTLFRLLSGLGKPTSGEVRMSDFRDDATGGAGVYLGVENLHPGRTVRETLRLSAYLAGLPRSRADERMAWAGLGSVDRRLVRSLSLGMRVRLGMALATLRPSRILLLDEPMNGLDVEAIGWVKSVARSHARSGGAVVISSHLLNELDVLADRALILSRGRLVDDTSLSEASASSPVRVRVGDDKAFAQALMRTTWSSTQTDGRWTIEATLEEVGSLALAAGVAVFELGHAPRATLESTFASLTVGEFSPRASGGRA